MQCNVQFCELNEFLCLQNVHPFVSPPYGTIKKLKFNELK